MYYRVAEAYDDDLHTDATVTNMNDVMFFNVTLPEKIGSNFPLLQLELDSDLRPNDYFNSGPFVIVSLKMKRILESVGADYEYFDVIITSDTATYPKGDFFFAHLLCEIDFLNKEKSVYTPYESNNAFIERIEKVVIDEKRMGGAPAAMLKNCFENVTVYQDKLVDKMIQESITGVEYKKIKSTK
ncbi:hypothetical protein NNQ28_00900 [Cronobacter dublinensis]|uniref:imm11 family protein n=1 Tax=Cronobacter dublinensis TaxID=413497 RepID=UPI0023DD3B51|nr:DUF1629 domain-containing protein [Cronobacter dublinensis]MDT3668654.1 hypothetical protein [Cronobacter dublinensis]WEP45522.1 hypothetical protein NNQ27_00840 [Cronobacter dublinensis]WNY83013.1 hypothetical protein NNQ28_00900 [Cronobacter dublinensis]